MPKNANVKRRLKDMNNTVNKTSENLKFQNDLNNKKNFLKMFIYKFSMIYFFIFIKYDNKL